ncbi:hypothetical protein BUALT_Bualt12G0031900 [Buddleja alternifolia]|uniref:Disease resistance protein At4g27190-like leucine-rich repeats domain-containing protein n=1 Tax=Buddleja alternifolia TaxID=168488 RepID=A0AAV6WYV9_9LAMI|nr:hypothetical protein BUALT_Bualt12G0031900 [Buddleja alternifolia]
MSLKWPREISLGNWIHTLLRSTEYLKLDGDGSYNLNLTQVQNIKTFDFRECSTVKKLVSTTSIDWMFGVFPVLEFLKLKNLPNLEEICNGPIQAGSNSFNNLKVLEILDLAALMYLWNSQNQNVSLSNLTSINIHCCDKLRTLFPLKMAKDGLSQLKELKIWSCEMMEEVFSNDGGGHITFPKLKILRLGSLPNLTTFCKGIESIEFSLLTELRIGHCQKLTSFVSTTGNNPRLAGHSDDSLHWFCNQKVTFGSLKELRIGGCENISNLWCHQIPPGFFSKLETLDIRRYANIRSLFSSSIVANLVNLKHLNISFCNEMVKVIENHKQNACENTPFFPSLETITIDSLSNLVNFCGWRCALQLPSLWRVLISDCPCMESFTMGPLTTPYLNSIDSQNEGNIWQLEEALYWRI